MELDEEVIKQYAELLKNGHEFPPLLVVFDGVDYWLVDGFHRRWAAVKSNVDALKCHVVEGTREDARWLSYGVNIDHGLPRSNEDKKKAVIAALKHPKGLKLSDGKIAEHCGVAQSMVSRHRKDMESTQLGVESPTRTGRDGRTTNTTNIGRKPAPKAEPKDDPPAEEPAPKAESPARPAAQAEKEPPRQQVKQPERAVFVELRRVFDSMDKNERIQAAALWASWSD